MEVVEVGARVPVVPHKPDVERSRHMACERVVCLFAVPGTAEELLKCGEGVFCGAIADHRDGLVLEAAPRSASNVPPKGWVF